MSLDTLRCTEPECLSKLSTLAQPAKEQFRYYILYTKLQNVPICFGFNRCRHATLALQATEMAAKTPLDISSLVELSEDQRTLVQKSSKDGKIDLFSLPGENICLPVFDDNAGDSSPPFTHVINGKVEYLYWDFNLLKQMYLYFSVWKRSVLQEGVGSIVSLRRAIDSVCILFSS